MTTKFNVGDKVYAIEGFEMNYITIDRIEINNSGVTYYSESEAFGYDEWQLHKSEKKTFIEMLKNVINANSYYSKTKVAELENLRNELFEVIARYED